MRSIYRGAQLFEEGGGPKRWHTGIDKILTALGKEEMLRTCLKLCDLLQAIRQTPHGSPPPRCKSSEPLKV